MKSQYDKTATKCEFQIGDKVLELLPIPGSALSAKFTGAYEVWKNSVTQTVISTPDSKRRTSVCHVNMLKAYYLRDSDKAIDVDSDVKTSHSSALIVVNPQLNNPATEDDCDNGLKMRQAICQAARLPNSKMLE